MLVRRSTFFLCCIVVLLASASVGRTETMQFKADLKAASEVPPNASAAIGTVTAPYDSATKQLSWKGSYSGLTGPATAAHIHGPAAVDAKARLVVWISENTGQCGSGECQSKNEAKTTPLVSPFEGTATLTDAQLCELMAGMYYVNVHTDAYPAGEIRGQLLKSP